MKREPLGHWLDNHTNESVAKRLYTSSTDRNLSGAFTHFRRSGVGLYDAPLMGINHARVAYSSLNEARSLIRLDLSDVIAKENSCKIRRAEREYRG